MAGTGCLKAEEPSGQGAGAISRRILVRGDFAEVNDKGLSLLAEHAELLN